MPVPVTTTLVSIPVSSLASGAGMTRVLTIGVALPSTLWTRRGTIRSPPFAIVAYTDAIWIGVTAMP